MSVSALYHLRLQVTETVTPSVTTISSTIPPKFFHRIDDLFGVLEAQSTPPATKAWSQNRTLEAATETLDLTALADVGFGAVDMTGLRIQLLKIVAGTIDISLDAIKGLSNGYTMETEYHLKTNEIGFFYNPEGLPEVEAGEKNIDISGAVGDTYQIIIVAG